MVDLNHILIRIAIENALVVEKHHVLKEAVLFRITVGCPGNLSLGSHKTEEPSHLGLYFPHCLF